MPTRASVPQSRCIISLRPFYAFPLALPAAPIVIPLPMSSDASSSADRPHLPKMASHTSPVELQQHIQANSRSLPGAGVRLHSMRMPQLQQNGADVITTYFVSQFAMSAERFPRVDVPGRTLIYRCRPCWCLGKNSHMHFVLSCKLSQTNKTKKR
jgi:hypothetical protein